ncbi:MAG: sodium:proton antiporter [Armatimonadota bacterium]
MGLGIERIETLLLIAAVVAMLARRLRLPYTVGLVLAGAVLALFRVTSGTELTKDLIFTSFLPPLVFEAAISIPWRELRRDLPVVLTLATLGVLLSAGITAAGMRYTVGWQWTSALLFGALIAATDPVSVIALFKELGVRGRLRLLVEAESLLNDGTAAVAFSIAMIAAAGGHVQGPGIAKEFVVMILGGMLCGGLVAGLLLLIAGRTEDHLLEITFTTVAAYGSFLVAEHVGVSGVLAVLTAGMLVGNVGSLGSISERGREAVASFWEYVAFVANSLIFLLIGMREAQLHFTRVMIPAVAAILLIMFGRALVVYLCCGLFRRSALRVPINYQHVLFWGGLRGALALALALGLPAGAPHREEIVSVAFIVVAFSVIAQGLTMRPLLNKLRLEGSAPGNASQSEETEAL